MAASVQNGNGAVYLSQLDHSSRIIAPPSRHDETQSMQLRGLFERMKADRYEAAKNLELQRQCYEAEIDLLRSELERYRRGASSPETVAPAAAAAAAVFQPPRFNEVDGIDRRQPAMLAMQILPVRPNQGVPQGAEQLQRQLAMLQKEIAEKKEALASIQREKEALVLERNAMSEKATQALEVQRKTDQKYGAAIFKLKSVQDKQKECEELKAKIQQLTDQTAEITRLTKELARTQDQVEGQKRTIQAKNQELEKARVSNRAFERKKEEIVDLKKQIDKLKQSEALAEKRLREALEANSAKDKRIEDLEGEQRGLAEVTEELEGTKRLVASLESDVRAARDTSADLRKDNIAKNKQLRQLEKTLAEKNQLQEQLKITQDLLSPVRQANQHLIRQKGQLEQDLIKVKELYSAQEGQLVYFKEQVKKLKEQAENDETRFLQSIKENEEHYHLKLEEYKKEMRVKIKEELKRTLESVGIFSEDFQVE